MGGSGKTGRLKQCKHADLLHGRRLLVDASLVEADAAYDSLVERDANDPKKEKPKKHQESYHDLNRGEKRQRRYSNRTHVSRTDPDATMVSRSGYLRRLYYKRHYTVDARSRLITDCHATTGSRHECPVLPERVVYQLNMKRYRIVGGHCRHCLKRAECLPEQQKRRARFVYRSPHQDEIGRIRRRQKTTRFKVRLHERHWKLEELFGDAKMRHTTSRALPGFE